MLLDSLDLLPTAHGGCRIRSRPNRAGPRHADSTNAGSTEFDFERDTLLDILLDAVKDDVDLMFRNSIASLTSDDRCLNASFTAGPARSFDLVVGCDGIHSVVRRLWFGAGEQYARFLGAYGSTTVVHKLLIKENTTQIYNEPGKAVMLNAYNGKTGVVFMFSAKQEIP